MNQPTIGALCYVRGIPCRITAILPAGTIEVLSTCGQYAFRVSGLAFRAEVQS